MFRVFRCACFFVFKQKTAYEMRISDWSSDVCSSDLASTSFARSTADRSMLRTEGRLQGRAQHRPQRAQPRLRLAVFRRRYRRIDPPIVEQGQREERKSGVEGKRVSVRVSLGVGRNLKKNHQ